MSQRYKNLFLRQSYLDSYEEYCRSLNKEDFPVWDYVVLTASNESQASFYRKQIEERLKDRKLPAKTHYAVVPDPEGKRVGSGGATFGVLQYIAKRENTNDFSGLKILCIHSGGDSKRVPQYSVCGKLFSPVPRRFADARRSTLFDEFIIGLTGIPARISGGLLVCSGDVLLLFNPLQFDFYRGGAAALSIKEPVSLGKNHGVFLSEKNGIVKRFLHKQTEEYLSECGAVDESGNVDIDTGAIFFDSNMLNDLYSLVDSDEKFAFYVNEEARLSFYGDFVYPLASESTLETFYLEKPEGEFTDALKRCRTELWNVLHKYQLSLLRFSPSSFIHFGTTKELLKLVTDDVAGYSYLGWEKNVNTNNKNQTFAASNSYVSPKATVGEGSYIEDSYIHKGSVVGKNCVISGVTLQGETVPDGSVLHGLKQKDGKFVVRYYSVDDNPKESKRFGQPIGEPLWTCRLFEPCDTIEEAVGKALAGDVGNTSVSLYESFRDADLTAVPMWQEKLSDKVKVESILEAIENGVWVEQVCDQYKKHLSPRVVRMLVERAEKLSLEEIKQFGKKTRIYYYLSKLVPCAEKEYYASKCFETIRMSIFNAAIKGTSYNDTARIKKEDVLVQLPVRANFGGGWSDTPPFCMEHGGTVLNVALKLNGGYPIEVTVKKIEEPKIILASTDIGSYGEFTELKPLQQCHNPGDPFALHKAALIACGVIPYKEEIALSAILNRLGGGLYLTTRVINIPKGSGLGTSSILAGACVKGLFEFLGINISENELYNRVLCMEQIMSTGGGWQDQVGGLAKGFKMVCSDVGLEQEIKCTKVCLSEDTLAELNERYALIYTGQRRLARNLLREVVGKYIGANPDALNVLYEIQRVAVLMRFELEKGNVDRFAKLFNKHWELSKTLDQGCTNTCIDQIFNSVEDMIDGKMICGAGGGGFLQVILKKSVTHEQLKQRLTDVFAQSGVDVWKCEFEG